jgi:prepilin-type processing-associated H-X9-DG protein
MSAATFRISMRGNWFLRAVLLACAILAAPGLRAEDLPLDLALISKEHVGFVQVRLADLWKSESFAPVRTLVAKAGPEMLRVFDQRFVPAPSSVERLTVIVTAAAQNAAIAPELVLVITTSRPFDRQKLEKSLLPEGATKKTGKFEMFVDANREVALRVFDERTFAFGAPQAIENLCVQPRGQAGKLQHAIDLATAGQSLVGAIKLESFTATLANAPLPPQLQALAEAQTFELSARLIKDPHIDCRLEFADAQHAEAGEQGIRFLTEQARQQLQTARAEMQTLIRGQESNQAGTTEELPKAAAGLVGLGLIELADEQLAKLPLKRKGEVLSLSIDVPQGPYGSMLAWGGFSAGLALPAVQKVRDSASRMASQNNLKQMALAMHNYESSYGQFPAAAICDKAGKPLLSWRVAILPFIEQQNLYNQFHLDEPWDSPHNIKLADIQVKLYRLPGVVSKPGDTKTHYRVFVGPNAAFEMKKSRRIADITDGTSNTLMIVEAAEAVPWTKPEGLEYDPEKRPPKLGRFYGGGCNVAFFDGSVHFLKSTLPEPILRALITPAGGEVIPTGDW